MARDDLGDVRRSATAWDTEDSWWRNNYTSRPYVRSGIEYEQLRPAYRYGWESANRYHNREWNDVESELRSGWDKYEHRGGIKAAWEDIKDAVKDAWDRVTGQDRDEVETTRTSRGTTGGRGTI
ncbi:MAG TPA: hypothetical protein VNK43_01095 [Gemmatimonadales bacterium]|nr:hypothetical protein [Gemmatimonadales bacterium]